MVGGFDDYDGVDGFDGSDGCCGRDGLDGCGGLFDSEDTIEAGRAGFEDGAACFSGRD